MFRKTFLLLAILLAIFLVGGTAITLAATQDENKTEMIIDRLEAKYGGENFSAHFRQESNLKAMDITDTANGQAWFKHPGMMRWEYKHPEKHVIVTDGDTLWVYRPADNQVVVGEAESHFGNGKGASFLSNFGNVKEAFDVGLDRENETGWRLKLIPRDKQHDLAAIYMTVDKEAYAIEQVTTENVYGDTTLITFDEVEFHDNLDNSIFHLDIPEGADVIGMDE